MLFGIYIGYIGTVFLTPHHSVCVFFCFGDYVVPGEKLVICVCKLEVVFSVA